MGDALYNKQKKSNYMQNFVNEVKKFYKSV